MVGSISSNRAKGQICTLEIVYMKTVENFLKSILLFIFLPIPYFCIASSGRPQGEWNTWLGEDSSAKRHYDSSVALMFSIWIGLFLTIVTSAIIHFLLRNNHFTQVIVDITMLTLNVMWISMLSSKIMLSYETWNWMKAIKFGNRLCETGRTESNQVAKAAFDFLTEELVIAGKNNSYKKFNHLEHIFRILDFWKGKRTDLADKASELRK